MSLNYPLNPDTSFESWFLTNEAEVIGQLGQSYNQNELVPINYQKIMQAVVDGFLSSTPVREFVSISDPYNYKDISDEANNGLQGFAYSDALNRAYEYWKDSLLPNIEIIGGVVTEMKTTILQDSYYTAPSSKYQIQTTFKINWLVIAAKSIYA
jgi:hypothetical protein